MRQPESFWNQVEVKEKKKKKMRELLESGSKEKEKGDDVLTVYVCGDQNAREKKEKKKETYG